MSVQISKVALASALGFRYVDGCAAARAGITRPQELKNFSAYNPDDGTTHPVMGYPVLSVSEGFDSDARLIPLLAYALKDLYTQYHKKIPWVDRNVCFYIAIPSLDRQVLGPDLLVDEDAKARRLQQAEYQGYVDEQRVRNLLRFAERLSVNSNELFDQRLKFYADGHTAVYHAAAAAKKDLDEGYCETAVVIGVDSLLDTTILGWLSEIGRLKTPVQAMGAMPAEACGILILESKSNSTSDPVAILSECFEVDSETSLYSEGLPQGKSLGRLAVMADKRRKFQEEKLWLISDNTGELWRVHELGNMLTRGLAKSKAFQTAEISAPAESFGDTGCAAGTVAICTAIEAWRRDYAVASEAVCLATGYEQTRRAVLLSKPA